MNLREIVKTLNLSVRASESELDRPVQGGYVSDLLSDVIAGANEGDLDQVCLTREKFDGLMEDDYA